jgi:hypothetical protein
VAINPVQSIGMQVSPGACPEERSPAGSGQHRVKLKGIGHRLPDALFLPWANDYRLRSTAPTGFARAAAVARCTASARPYRASCRPEVQPASVITFESPTRASNE